MRAEATEALARVLRRKHGFTEHAVAVALAVLALHPDADEVTIDWSGALALRWDCWCRYHVTISHDTGEILRVGWDNYWPRICLVEEYATLDDYRTAVVP